MVVVIIIVVVVAVACHFGGTVIPRYLRPAALSGGSRYCSGLSAMCWNNNMIGSHLGSLMLSE